MMNAKTKTITYGWEIQARFAAESRFSVFDSKKITPFPLRKKGVVSILIEARLPVELALFAPGRFSSLTRLNGQAVKVEELSGFLGRKCTPFFDDIGNRLALL